MMKIFTTMLVALAFSLTSALCVGSDSTKPSPESIVTCQTVGPAYYGVVATSVPTAINTEQCSESPEGFAASCAHCIRALEDQGCNIVDVAAGKSNEIPNVTYFLSCVKP